MGKYALLQGKRLIRLLILTLPVMALLLGLLILGGKALITARENDETQQPFPIGIVGLPESGMLRLGLTALESLDDIGMALEVVELTAEEAPDALAQGTVKAYAVIPEGFAREATHGRLLTIQYITTPDASGMASLFQQEVTDLIGRLLIESEKASFGTYDALAPHIGHDRANRAINDLSTTLAEFIFIRNRATVTLELGVESAPSFASYLACGLTVTWLLLMSLAFAPLTVQQHLGVCQMLRARGQGGIALALTDWAMLALGMGLAAAALYGCAAGLLPQLTWQLLLQSVPAVLVTVSLAYLGFSLSCQLHHALLVHFFAMLALALAGGCLYPAWFFPESIQRLAALLPTALARRYLTGCVSGHFSLAALAGCLGYSLVFTALGCALRIRRTEGHQEVQP